MVNEVVKANTQLTMDQFIQANFLKGYNMEKESLFGATGEFTTEIGSRIRCMVRVRILGQMESGMKESIETERKMDKVRFNGLENKDMSALGQMEFSTEKEFIQQLKEKLNTEFGKMDTHTNIHG